MNVKNSKVNPKLPDWQNCKAWDSLFHPVPPSLLFLPLLSVSSVLLYRFSLSPSPRESVPANPAMRFGGTGNAERSFSGFGAEEPAAANAFLRHCESRKRIWWQQFWQSSGENNTTAHKCVRFQAGGVTTWGGPRTCEYHAECVRVDRSDNQWNKGCGLIEYY